MRERGFLPQPTGRPTQLPAAAMLTANKQRRARILTIVIAVVMAVSVVRAHVTRIPSDDELLARRAMASVPRAPPGTYEKCNLARIMLDTDIHLRRFQRFMRILPRTSGTLEAKLARTSTYRARYKVDTGRAIPGSYGRPLESTRRLEIAVASYPIERYSSITTAMSLGATSRGAGGRRRA